jgi:hypothetical protein
MPFFSPEGKLFFSPFFFKKKRSLPSWGLHSHKDAIKALLRRYPLQK